MKPEPNTTSNATEQSPPTQADQQPASNQQTLGLSAVLAERELDEALARWDNEGGACP